MRIENQGLFLIALAAFLTWAILSTSWSVWSRHDQAYKLAVLATLGLAFVAAPRNPDLLGAGVAACCVLLTLLLAVEALFDLPLTRAAAPDAQPGEHIRGPSRGAVVLLGLGWAGLAVLWRWGRSGWTFVLAGGIAFVSAQFGQLATAIAFVLGVLAAGVALAAPRLPLRALCSSMALWVLAAPFVTPLLLGNAQVLARLPHSWEMRAGIWRYVCERILERPWFGRGLDASRAVRDHIEVRGADMIAVPLHPHSASLQIWYETGAVGAMLCAAALVLGGEVLARRAAGEKLWAGACAATLASLGLIANVSYGAWQEWWLATMLMAAAALAAARRPEARG